MAHPTASGKKKTTVAGVVIAILIGGYSLLRPAINDVTGLNLPGISQQDADRITSAGTGSTASDSSPTAEVKETATGADQNAGTAEKSGTGQTPGTAKPGPLASRMKTSDARPSDPAPTRSDAVEPTTDDSLEYGILREVSKDRFISPAGLMYTPGSAEGHRIEHLRRHVTDQPNRVGKHGVFDGGMEGALKMIDQAYENAKADKRTTKKTDRQRTIYTVDMGKRVGYVGGREGNRSRKPMARRVQLVIEGNRLITAYPL